MVEALALGLVVVRQQLPTPDSFNGRTGGFEPLYVGSIPTSGTGQDRRQAQRSVWGAGDSLALAPQ